MSSYEPPSESERIPLSFFTPGESYLVLDHESSLRGGELLQHLQEHPFVVSQENAILRERLTNALAAVNPENIITITGSSEPTGSNWLIRLLVRIVALFTRAVNWVRRRDQTVLQAAMPRSQVFIPQPQRIMSMVFMRLEEFKDPKQQLDFLSEFIQPLYTSVEQFLRADEQLTVQTISPNWLMSGAQGQFGSGGPGARPVPTSPNLATGAMMLPWEYVLPKTLQKVVGQAAQMVEVAVLDTVPPADDLNNAYKNLTGHKLLQQLKGQITKIDRIISDSSDWKWLNDDHDGAAIDKHVYKMSDHGLFVAGIIASLAPQARIRIIEVLSHWGVGTVETISKGLSKLHNEPRTMPLVVNLSLTLETPEREYLKDYKDDPRIKEWEKFFDWLEAHPNFLSDSIAGIKELCKQLNDSGAVIIAAAGNNGKGEPDRRLPARYPAAFDSVTGVGALNRDGTEAPYTNEADEADPAHLEVTMGFVTFGGNMNMSNLSADQDDGVLGIYIGQFPDKKPSQNGWARWAGTSFAAPAITGTFAFLIAGGSSRQQAMNEIRAAQCEIKQILGPGEVLTTNQGTK